MDSTKTPLPDLLKSRSTTLIWSFINDEILLQGCYPESSLPAQSWELHWCYLPLRGRGCLCPQGASSEITVSFVHGVQSRYSVPYSKFLSDHLNNVRNLYLYKWPIFDILCIFHAGSFLGKYGTYCTYGTGTLHLCAHLLKLERKRESAEKSAREQ